MRGFSHTHKGKSIVRKVVTLRVVARVLNKQKVNASALVACPGINCAIELGSG